MQLRHVAPSFVLGLLISLLSAWNAIAAPVVHTSTSVTEEMLFTDDPKDWAKPKVVVPPQFPVDQLAANARGYVDISVALDPRGKASGVTVTKSEPQNVAFEQAVLEVANLWTFNAPIDNTCVPRESTGNVRVWFDIREGKGLVSVSGNVSPATVPTPNPARKIEWDSQGQSVSPLKYPVLALRDRIQADLLVAIRVEAATGLATDSVVTWIETSGNTTATVAESFKTAVIKSLKRAKFKPREGKDYKVCVPYKFRFT